jgi:hypothetical protein
VDVFLFAERLGGYLTNMVVKMILQLSNGHELSDIFCGLSKVLNSDYPINSNSQLS